MGGRSAGGSSKEQKFEQLDCAEDKIILQVAIQECKHRRSKNIK